MEALKNLIANIPNWSKRLDELSKEIDKRQLHLARIDSEASTKPKSIRNRGSTESLRPKDEGEALPVPPQAVEAQLTTPNGATQNQHTQQTNPAESQPCGLASNEPSIPQMPAPPPALNATLALQQQSHQAKAVARAFACATGKRRHRSDSVISQEGGTLKYRTRSMIIVYYDSYVQSFFEELVRFVSASRNLMRKAKMAAKLAQIKKLAELELPEPAPEKPKDGAHDGQIEVDPANGTLAVDSNTADTDAVTPALQFKSTQMRNMSRTSAMLAASRAGGYTGATSALSMAMSRIGQPPDVYDELDKGLEYVQSMCEHAAHQFLRDGDCNEEIDNVKRRLGETRDIAEKEMDRVAQEDPDALNKPVEEEAGVTKFRSFRPLSIRRELVPSSPTEKSSGKIDVDEGIDDTDGEAPNLVFKSARMMQ